MAAIVPDDKPPILGCALIYTELFHTFNCFYDHCIALAVSGCLTTFQERLRPNFDFAICFCFCEWLKATLTLSNSGVQRGDRAGLIIGLCLIPDPTHIARDSI